MPNLIKKSWTVSKLKAAVAALAAYILKTPRICSKSKYLHISYTPYKFYMSYTAVNPEIQELEIEC